MTTEPIIILVDSREQRPYRFQHDRVTALDCGDYSAVGVEHLLRIERKSLVDFLTCVGQSRARFERCLARMTAYPLRYLVVEGSLPELARGGWPYSLITPSQAIGTLLGWSMTYGVQPLLVNDRAHGAATVRRLVTLALRYADRQAARSPPPPAARA